MKKLILTVVSFAFFAGYYANGQTKDITVAEVPKDVITLLNKYVQILQTSTSLDDAATKVAAIAGGHLLNSSGQISGDVKPYSLKKDFENAKFYKYPVVITRVSRTLNDYDGFQNTLFEGTRYKIWIAKKDGVAGLPAPIPIIKPARGVPKVVSVIGSL